MDCREYRQTIRMPGRQHGAEGDVEDLPGVEVLEQRREIGIRHASGFRCGRHGRRHVVARPVLLVPTARERVDGSEQVRRHARDGPQRLEVTRARGLQVNQAAGVAGGDLVEAELVRAGVQADLVRPEHAGNGGVARACRRRRPRGRRCSRRPSRTGRRSAARGWPTARRDAAARTPRRCARPGRSACLSRQPTPRGRRAGRRSRRTDGGTSPPRARRRGRTSRRPLTSVPSSRLHGLALDVERPARQARAHRGRAVLEPVPRQGVPRLAERRREARSRRRGSRARRDRA